MKKIITLVLALISVLLSGSVGANGQKPELVMQKGHASPVVSLAFGADGKILVSGERNGIVKVWDLRNGNNLRDVQLNSELRQNFALHPGGRAIFTPGKDECAFWDLQDGKKLQSFKCGDGQNYFSDRQFSFASRILAVGEQGSFRVSNLAAKSAVKMQGGIREVFKSVFSPDGKILAVSHYRSEETAAKLAAENGGAKFSSGYAVEFYDAESGQFLRAMEQQTESAEDLSFSADGRIFAGMTREIGTFNGKSKIFVWDAATGAKTAEHDAGFVPSNIALSGDGAIVAVGTENSKIALYENAAKTPRLLDNKTETISAVAFSPDGKTLAAGGANGSIYLWDFRTGREPSPLGAKILPASRVTINAENQYLFVAQKNYAFSMDGGYEFDSTARVFDVEGSFKPNFLPKTTKRIQISDFIFAPDGKTFLMTWITLGKPGVDAIPGGFIQAKTDTAQPIILGTGKEPTFSSFAYSPDGKNLATTGKLNAINVWNLAQNKLLYKIPNKYDGAVSLTETVLAFTPDGKTLLRAGDDTKIRFFDAATGQPQKVTDFTRENALLLNFSPDAKSIAFTAISSDGDRRKIYLWNVAEGRVSHTFSGHAGEVSSAAFTADGKILFSSDEGGNIKFWDVAAQKELANLVFTGENDWVVTTPEGLFDGTPAAWQKLFWRFDNNIFKLAPLEAFFNEFYYPNLLKEILSGNAPPPPQKQLSEIDIRQPNVRIRRIGNQTIAEKNFGQSVKSSADAASRSVEVTLEVTENVQKPARPAQSAASGANDARLFRNGSLVKHWKGDVFDKASGCEQTALKPNEPRRALCKTDLTILAGTNDLTAYAFNRENVKSNNDAVAVKGSTGLKRGGTLYVLAIGVNRYQNAGHNLRYAVADADSISGELIAQQAKILQKNYSGVEVVKLTDERATKKNILQALRHFSPSANQVELTADYPVEVGRELEKISPAQPEDALVIYYAGHGTASKDRFYLIPHDGFPPDSTVGETFLKSLYEQSISDEELEKSLETVDAGKMLMIIDACNSGQALNAEEQRRGPMNSRGLAQLAYEKGIFILTAAQSEQAALEVSKLGHGLLTYSLLEGLRKAERRPDGTIAERSWFDYAVRQVPQMQLEEMRKRDVQITRNSDSRSGVVFIKGANKNLSPEKRGLQSPRIFYRREAENNPLIVAAP